MQLPADFLDELDAEARANFLQDLVVRSSEADAYQGDLSDDCQQLERDIRRGQVLVTFDEDSESFALLRRD